VFKKGLGGLLLAGMLIPSLVSAQDYPEKTVTVVVPFLAGGSNDTIARYMAEGLSTLWGQPFVVENRAGGGTAVGAAHVANSEPDGYTILFVSGSYTINASTRTDLPFDPVNDLSAVAIVGLGEIGIVSGPRVKIETIDDLIREAKVQDLYYATAGIGSQQHFFAALLADTLGIEMTAVPYPGGAEGLVDLLGGRVDLVVGTVSGLLTPIENGAVPVAVMGEARTPSLPNVPTVAELGYPEATTTTFWAVFVPDGTPPEIIDKLHEGITSQFATPEGVKFLASLDARPSDMSAADAQAHITNEIQHWTELAQKLGISAAN
jgi:tripartite-type tricarboxylate transporter receptor subunit TctC